MGSSFDTERDTPEYENLAKLAEDMVFRLPGCADVMVRKSLASAYRDFCKRTCVLTTRRVITLTSGERRYAIYPRLPDCIVDCVVRVETFEGREIGRSFYSIEGNAIVFESRYLPNEDETQDVAVVCVEIPKIGSEKASQGFIEKYGDAITNGALSRLYSMTGKAWSDAQQAVFCATEYENALTEARSRYHSGGNDTAGSLNFMRKGLVL